MSAGIIVRCVSSLLLGARMMTTPMPVSERNVWSMEGLHDTYFWTYSACRAQTRFDSHGTPIETMFKDVRSDEVSRIRYVCDEKGRILEAVQSLGPGFFTNPLVAAAGPPPLAVEAEGPPILITLGTEAYRRSFRYNDAGRIIESKGHFFGRRTDYSAMTCNHRGDILTLTTDDKPLNCFEYEYDEHDANLGIALLLSPRNDFNLGTCWR